MSGAGGNFYRSRVTSKEFIESLKAIRESNINFPAYESSVNKYLLSELVLYENRKTNEISNILDNLFSSLSKRIVDHIDLLFGGIIEKDIPIDSICDIDAILVIDGDKLDGLNSQKLQDIIYQLLLTQYDEEKINKGPYALSIKIESHTLQLLPAAKINGKIMITDYNSLEWSKAPIKELIKELVRVNSENNNRVVPIIKIIKVIINNLPEKQRISGSYIELLATNIFENYNEPKTLKNMLQYFFEQSIDLIKCPAFIISKQQVNNVEFAGEEGSLKRRLAEMALERIYRKLNTADSLLSIEIWKDILKTHNNIKEKYNN